jgi:hypothetical protein
VPSPGWHAESPDIWVRRNPEPVPSLAWSAAPPHENPVRGQDNYVFCRVRNRGTAAADVVYLRASITHYPGFEFRYPQEFQPSRGPGALVPSLPEPGTYFLGEQRIAGLAPGANSIVRITWPQALVPPATVVIGGIPVQWHPCLLLEASPHDGPAPAAGVTAVRSDNNIAQRNIHIDDGSGGDSFIGMIAGTMDKTGVERLLIDASGLKGEAALRLRFADDALTRRLAQAMKDFGGARPRPGAEAWQPAGTLLWDRIGRWMRTAARAAAGAATGLRSRASREDAMGLGVSLVNHHGVEAVELTGIRRPLEVRLRLAGGELAPLLVAIVGPAKGELRLSQIRGDGARSPGYTIRR